MDSFVIFSLFLSFGAGFIAHICWIWQLKRTALSIVRTDANVKGRQAQKEQEGELMALISEATMEFKAAKEKGEDIKTAAARIVPALVAKYPTTVVKHGRKLFKMATKGGGLEGLEGFL